jgi:hypothetical protein
VCLRRRRGLLWNQRALYRIRGIKCALIARQRENTAQAALAMLRGCAADFMIAMNLREQVGGIYRAKVSQANFFQVRREVSIPERFVAGDGRGLAILTRPRKPVRVTSTGASRTDLSILNLYQINCSALNKSFTFGLHALACTSERISSPSLIVPEQVRSCFGATTAPPLRW